jgi:hypothetical protein
MKILSPFKPEFDPANKTLDFSNFPDFNQSRLYAVINVTRNVPIYIPGSSGYGANVSSNSATTLVLSYDTTSHSVTDNLNIYYESDFDGGLSDPVLMGLDKIHQTLHFMLTEMKINNELLIEGFNIKNDIEKIRNDINSFTDENSK